MKLIVKPNDLTITPLSNVILRGDTIEVALSGFTALSVNVASSTTYYLDNTPGVGTIAVSGTTVTGTGTSFTTFFNINNYIKIGTVSALVTAVTNNTTLTINTSLTVSAGTAYSIQRQLGVGTVSLLETTVTGIGTTFTTFFKVGQTIDIQGQRRLITAIASTTSMTVAFPQLIGQIKKGDIRSTNLDTVAILTSALDNFTAAGSANLIFIPIGTVMFIPDQYYSLEIQCISGSSINTIYRTVFVATRDVVI